MNNKEVAADLRYCRRESGLSGADVSHLLAITPSRLSRLESGKSEPRPIELCGFSMIYGKGLFSVLPDISARIADDIAKRLDDIPEEPSNWKAHDARLRALQHLYQRLERLTKTHSEA